MNTPPTAPPASNRPAKASNLKLLAIIFGSLLFVAAVGVSIWFLLPKKELVVKEAPPPKPDTRLSEYIRGKRFSWLLPKESLPKELMGTPIGQQIAKQQVFAQFNTNSIVQFGTIMNGRAVAIESGGYSSVDLTIKINKDGGTDTVVAPTVKPAEGDELTLTDALGKEVKLSILKVEPAAPLESASAAMLAGLGLGGASGTNSLGNLSGLAGLLPTSQSPSASTNSYTESGYTQPSSIGRKNKWTFGGKGKDLTRWKGQPARNVLSVFGNPPDQAKPWGQGGGAWTYYNLDIVDGQGKLHKSVTFFVLNGAVVEVKLPN